VSSGGFFRQLRILLLLLVLLVVGGGTWLTQLRTTSWNQPLWVVIYPINGDGSSVAREHIASLQAEDFQSIEAFFRREARRHGVAITDPVTIRLAPEVRDLPPAPPAPGRNTLAIMAWSLEMRYWAQRRSQYPGPTPDIRMFVVYHDPDLHPRLAHSLGLQKGGIGVVNAYAHHRNEPRNHVIIAHELLHTLGASDKYDPGNSRPLFPIGYADPEQVPLHPQQRAELMGGRVPISTGDARIPDNFREVVIGPDTAREIRWLRKTP
jgi:hypothetical protein